MSRGRNNKLSGLEQEGVALLVLVFILALAVTAYALQMATANEFKADRELKTSKALMDAKSALLGWSVLQNTPGQLPCPEDTSLIGLPTEGQAKTSCSLPAIGRLPWRTLGLGDIRDGNGDKLWYVISSGFRTPPINSNTPAQLSIDGIPNSAVAIIFSVGLPFAGQARAAYDVAPAPITNYLEASNSDGDNTFISQGVVGSFNDRLLAIKQSELFSIVTNRVLRMVRGDSTEGLIKYYAAYGNVYPFADANNDGYADGAILVGSPSYQGGTDSIFFSSSNKTTLQNNAWFSLMNYSVTTDQQLVALTLNGKTIQVSP